MGQEQLEQIKKNVIIASVWLHPVLTSPHIAALRPVPRVCLRVRLKLAAFLSCLEHTQNDEAFSWLIEGFAELRQTRPVLPLAILHTAIWEARSSSYLAKAAVLSPELIVAPLQCQVQVFRSLCYERSKICQIEKPAVRDESKMQRSFQIAPEYSQEVQRYKSRVLLERDRQVADKSVLTTSIQSDWLVG